MPFDEMESLHRLSDVELRNEEGSIPSIVHRPNLGPFGKTRLLLLLGWIFRLQTDCNSFGRSREEDVHMSFWHIFL